MANVNQETLTARIERELEAQAGINAVVEESGRTIVLSGKVDSAEARQAAEDIVATIAPDRPIDNGLEIEQVVPQGVSRFYAGGEASADVPESVAEIHAESSDVDPDFSDERLSSSGLEMAGVSRTEESDNVFFPPTDPVIAPDRQGNVHVAGGFSPTAETRTGDIQVAPSASDNQLGDEAIEEAIRRQLRDDAATTALSISIQVVVREGAAHLRGQVPDMEDAANAEEVASRVPGVREVIEELEVQNP
jgi:osmotically-inducible protein OsmY